MELKGRLKLIAEKVQQSNFVCDIGTDHAYIPIYLVLNNICKKAVAADVRIGPIEAAKSNIRSYKLEGSIEARLGDGLDPIKRGECDTIVIAGMGGMLIRDILTRGLTVAKEARLLVLQPMNALEVLRCWLFENGFEILDEGLADEGEKIYNVMCARWTDKITNTDEIYCHIGEKLIEKKDPLLSRYLNKRLKQIDKALNEMKASSNRNTDVEKEYRYMKERIMDLLKII